YGRPPGTVSAELLKLIFDRTGQKPVEGRNADALPPRMPKLREELAAKNLPTDDEACVLHAMFPVEFAKLHQPAAPAAPAPAPAPAAAPAVATPAASAPTGPGQRYALTINGRRTEVTVAEIA
ncbi:MAG: pyruvate carboxyltransferase, partial [Verrucomicrobia bacterium]|nr:pyruvate carboxyltransferase [Verrucomicrobiota bacterium]